MKMKNKDRLWVGYIPILSFLFVLFISSFTYAQKRVSGKVTDSEGGSALPGVTVLVKGTSSGTATDAQGNYSIAIPAGSSDILVFSFVGYVTQEIAVGNQSTINVSLVADVTALQEVIVTGYSTQQKKEITGAIATVSTKELLAVPAPNFAQQLQGRAAGVTIGNDNSPGGSTMVRIRGFGTINDNSPLYVIDGVPFKSDNGQGLNSINQNDIESISILKDASVASIYGARAGNGVIIITTKKGKSGAPKVSFDAYTGVQTPRKYIDLMNVQQLAELEWLRQRNTGLPAGQTNPSSAQYGSGPNPVIPDYIFPAGAREGDPRVNPANYSADIDDPEFGRTKFLITRANKQGTDWWREIAKPAIWQNYNLTASGGTDKARYMFSGNYLEQNGIIIHTGFRRYTVRANTEFSVANRARIGQNLQIGYTERVEMPAGNQSEGNPVSGVYRAQPIVPVYDIAGNFAGHKGTNLGNAQNPVAQLVRNKDNKYRNMRIFGNVFAEVDIAKNLVAKTSFGLDYNIGHGSFYSIRNIEAAEPSASNRLDVNTYWNSNWTWTNTLTYNRTFNEVHKLNAYVGTEAIRNTFRDFGTGRNNFFTDDLNFRFINAGAGLPNSFGGGGEWALFSIFGRAEYGFKEKYLFSATVRRDGSSRFGQANRYGVFPAFSAGWVLSDEDFLKNNDIINFAKIRAGWGQSGNHDGFGDYPSYSTLGSSINETFYDIRGTSNSAVLGFAPQSTGNPNIKWEATATTNVGLDVTLLKNLELNIDAYNRKTTDLLYNIQQPATAGNNIGAPVSIVTNIGSMQTRGLDFALTYNGDAMNGDLKYSVNANISLYRNKLLNISGIDNDFIADGGSRIGNLTRSIVGQPLSMFWGYFQDGIFRSQAEVEAANALDGNRNTPYQDAIRPGRFRFRDINGDGVVNADDNTVIGNPHPKFTYGFNLNASYKGFDLTVFLQGVQGNDIFNFFKYQTDFNVFQGNRSTRLLDTWTEQNPNASMPRWDSDNGSADAVPSSYYVEKGSYLRARNIQIGYNLPSTALGKVGIERLRVYLQAQNLFTITKYSGLDPEITLANFGTGGDRTIGVDYGAYPAPKTFLLGLSIGF
jgi:TonB-linked SusC/RagA family outer membrane protein